MNQIALFLIQTQIILQQRHSGFDKEKNMIYNSIDKVR